MIELCIYEKKTANVIIEMPVEVSVATPIEETEDDDQPLQSKGDLVYTLDFTPETSCIEVNANNLSNEDVILTIVFVLE